MIFKKILCPTDFSEASYEGLNKAIELATQGTTEICVLHVEPIPGALTPLAGLAPDARTEADRRAQTVKNLCAALEERVPETVRTRPLLKQGEVIASIVQAANEEGADLIVLTTHGAGGLQPGELGSIATGVLQTACCPVLTVNRPVEAAKAPNYPAELFNATAMPPEFEAVHSTNHTIYLDGD